MKLHLHDSKILVDFKMRVVLGCTVWARGVQQGHLDGIGVYTRELSAALTECDLGLKGIIFGKEPKIETGNSEEATIPFPHFYTNKNLQFEAGLAYSIGKNFVLPKELCGPIDLLHATDHLIPRHKHIPVIATVMDLIPLLHPEWIGGRFRRAKNFVFRQSIRQADHVITISEFSKSAIVETLGVSEQNISVIPLGVDKRFFKNPHRGATDSTAILSSYDLQRGYFLVLGTLQPRKNIERILKAHQQLPNEIRQLHPLVIVGRYGWGVRDLIPKIDELEATSECKWLKFVSADALPHLLQSAKALIFPSLYEGFGLPVIEAFAAGCPVITSKTTALPEVSGDSAILVDPYDTNDIANAMRSLIWDDDLREEMIEKGLQRAAMYSWQSCAAKTLEAYRKVCG